MFLFYFHFVLFLSISVHSYERMKTIYHFVKAKGDRTFASYCTLIIPQCLSVNHPATTLYTPIVSVSEAFHCLCRSTMVLLKMHMMSILRILSTLIP